VVKLIVDFLFLADALAQRLVLLFEVENLPAHALLLTAIFVSLTLNNLLQLSALQLQLHVVQVQRSELLFKSLLLLQCLVVIPIKFLVVSQDHTVLDVKLVLHFLELLFLAILPSAYYLLDLAHVTLVLS